MKSLRVLGLGVSQFLLLLVIVGCVLSDDTEEAGSEEGKGDGDGDGDVAEDVENFEHPDCHRCKENEFYELHNTMSLYPSGYCFGTEMPAYLTLTGLAMNPKDWWHAQISCQRFGGYLYEPIFGNNTLDYMKILATEAHGSGCPTKRRKVFQEYWTGLHFQPDLFDENDQPQVIGASTGLSLASFVEFDDIHKNYFYDGNPDREKANSHPGIYESCVEMGSSDHVDGGKMHGRLNDDDCWAQSLPLCSFSYIAI